MQQCSIRLLVPPAERPSDISALAGCSCTVTTRTRSWHLSLVGKRQKHKLSEPHLGPLSGILKIKPTKLLAAIQISDADRRREILITDECTRMVIDLHGMVG